jgi:peptidylprolyl isomerase
MTYNFRVVEEGKQVTLHYTGTLDDGTEFDSSHNRDEPLTFVVGTGQMIPGFEKKIIGLKEGEKNSFSLTPDEAYGTPRANMFQIFPKTDFPDDFEIVVGNMINVPTQDGQVHPAVIDQADDIKVILNFNHPLAGKNLNFKIQVVSVTTAKETTEEGVTLGEISTNAEETG